MPEFITKISLINRYFCMIVSMNLLHLILEGKQNKLNYKNIDLLLQNLILKVIII